MVANSVRMGTLKNVEHRVTGFLVRRLGAMASRWHLNRARRVGRFVGKLMHALLPSRARIARCNLNLALGSELNAREREDIIVRSFCNIAMSAFEFMHSPSMTEAQWNREISFEGEQHLKDAYAQGKGVIYLTAHYGNWEFMGAELCRRGYPLTVIARNLHNVGVDDLLNEVRDRVGMEVLTGSQVVRMSLRTLAAGKLLGVLADQDAGPGALFLPFFGVRAATAVGPAVLAVRTGAPVVPAFTVRRPDNGHTVHICPPLEMVKTGQRDADAAANTQRMMLVLEEWIRRHPDHWFWFHKRWRTRPPGEDPASRPEISYS